MPSSPIPRPTPEAFLAAYPPQVQAIATRLRQLITTTVPEVDEAVYVGWQLIGYRVRDGKKSHYFAFVAPLVDQVRLGFEEGVLLSDPDQILRGNGRQVRYVPMFDADAIDEALLAPLIAEAAMLAAMRRRR
jgi:hypothetical protein